MTAPTVRATSAVGWVPRSPLEPNPFPPGYRDPSWPSWLCVGMKVWWHRDEAWEGASGYVLMPFQRSGRMPYGPEPVDDVFPQITRDPRIGWPVVEADREFGEGNLASRPRSVVCPDFLSPVGPGRWREFVAAYYRLKVRPFRSSR
jgi:hypothetical protein